jgi:hypothetical protein
MSRVSLREGRDRQERKKSPKIGGSGAIAHAEAPCCSSFDIQNPSAIGDLFELCCDVVMSYLVLLNRRFEASVAYKKHVVRNISLAMSGYSLHLSFIVSYFPPQPPDFFFDSKVGARVQTRTNLLSMDPDTAEHSPPSLLSVSLRSLNMTYHPTLLPMISSPRVFSPSRSKIWYAFAHHLHLNRLLQRYALEIIVT